MEEARPDVYPVFGIRGGSWFLGVAEWLFAVLLLLGFWNKKLGILGALGSVATFLRAQLDNKCYISRAAG